MNFKPLANNAVEGFALVRSVECKTGKNGEYLDLMLCDKSGEINGKIWKYRPAEHGTYAANDLIKIRGVVREFNGTDQLSIEKIRKAVPTDGVAPEDFVVTAAYAGTQMFDTLYEIADGFADADLRKIVTTILKDFREKLLFWPAAYKLHHAVNGGLLLHTLSIVRLAEGVCRVYPFVDRELLLAGAMLHDMAKIEEFKVNDLGIAEDYSVRGNLLGHLAMGAMTVEKYAKQLNINPQTALLLEHMVLSHHGEPEFGAAVRPQFIEAELLSELDLMDSRVYEMRDAVSHIKPEEFSGRIWALDNRKLYRNPRTDLEQNVEIF